MALIHMEPGESIAINGICARPNSGWSHGRLRGNAISSRPRVMKRVVEGERDTEQVGGGVLPQKDRRYAGRRPPARVDASKAIGHKR